ncbi:sensor histidine kinase TmoS [Clostridium acetireducens DSM 10703]|uniref:histidine kinase n=1 Tax=Clostridium acetireducens DSM 10703 TaxID=1121290 RepID=A0A1E8EW77_9CLOT|nr:HAMP domain-containing sensor histidine kinase [Clostridium acetireducens]OFI01515.1 sensor histidine kinase TmoS [Clostridium acetireducens DSM 10703]
MVHSHYPVHKSYNLNIKAFCIKDNLENILFNILIIENITEKENAKLLLEEKENTLKKYKYQNKLKVEFLANICHELRTPLNIILSAIQLIDLSLKKLNSKCLFNSKTKKYFSNVKQNCLRLLKIINNLIDITKIDAGYFKVNFTNNNIVSVIEDVVLSAVPYVENKSINLIFDTNVEEKIMAFDVDKIERIILNLISNSVKFTNPNGTIFVNLIDKENFILISIKDTGIGIPKDKLNTIFNRYKQVDNNLHKNHQGSGIGLSLVKSLVHMHNGNIFVKSDYGKGCEFIIKLPVKLVSINKIDNEIKNNKFNNINIELSDM